MPKSVKSALLATALVCISSIDAYATSGADLLQNGPEWGNGFVWGVVEAETSVMANNAAAIRLAHHRNKCLIDANINSETIYQAVHTHIKNHPVELGQPAALAVLNVIFEMCGPPSLDQ